MEYYMYLVEVISDGIRVERITFTYKDDALSFAERRRKQGYLATIKPVTAKAEPRHLK